MFGGKGSKQGEFDYPCDVAVDNKGFVYVADQSNHRIQKFTIDGQFARSFGTKGSQPGQLNYSDLVYVSDQS